MAGILALIGVVALGTGGFFLMRKIDRWIDDTKNDRPLKD